MNSGLLVVLGLTVACVFAEGDFAAAVEAHEPDDVVSGPDADTKAQIEQEAAAIRNVVGHTGDAAIDTAAQKIADKFQSDANNGGLGAHYQEYINALDQLPADKRSKLLEVIGNAAAQAHQDGARK
ncbi:hypothetical protein AAVH_30785 [Aphelenchoides avenae]|nr:hypothetical protein AAVH_30785 [Aphelenchus avenae]